MTPPRPVIACKSSDGTAANQTCEDEGPLTLERSKTVDEEISSHVDRLPRSQRPQEDQQAVLRLVQPGAHARHDGAVADKYQAMVGEPGGKDWGINEAGMKQMDDNIGVVIKKLEDMGQLDNTILCLHHRQRCRDHHLSRRRHHAVQGRKAHHLGRRHARSDARSLAGTHQAGHDQDRHLRLARLAADVRRHRRRPQGRRSEEGDRTGTYPGIVKTTLDGVDQRDYLEGKTDKSARDTFFYYSGSDPSAVRYKNWKIYFAMDPTTRPASWQATQPSWTQVVNIKRDPFETSIGQQKDADGHGWRAGRPDTAYLYDWNMLPIGQALWLKELASYIAIRRCRSRRATT